MLFSCLRPPIFNSDLLANSDSSNDLFIKSHSELLNRSAGVCNIILSNTCVTLYLSFTNTCSTQAFSQLLLHVLEKSTLWPATPQRIVLLATLREFWFAKRKSFGFPCQVCPTLSRECISFLTIITTVLGSAILLSRSSQEEMPSKLERDYVIVFTSNNPSPNLWTAQYTCWTLVLKFTWL